MPLRRVGISQNPSGAIELGGSLTNPASELRGTLIDDCSRPEVTEGGIMVEDQVTGPMFSASGGLGMDEMAVR
eukprot:12970648-Alexandrium_andersonii.AAC.1